MLFTVITDELFCEKKNCSTANVHEFGFYFRCRVCEKYGSCATNRPRINSVSLAVMVVDSLWLTICTLCIIVGLSYRHCLADGVSCHTASICTYSHSWDKWKVWERYNLRQRWGMRQVRLVRDLPLSFCLVFLLVSQSTPIMSLSDISLLVFVTDTECGLWEVGTEGWYIRTKFRRISVLKKIRFIKVSLRRTT